MSRHHPRGRILTCMIFVLVFALPAAANWTASGTFRYQDREWDQNGFTGTLSERPIRFADVDVFDVGKNKVITTGKTDANGAFSIAVTDTTTRTVKVRALTQTVKTTDLFVKVIDRSPGQGNVYAVSSGNVTNHNPNTNVNFGILVAAVGNGGEPFNALDLGILGADYIKYLTGSRPNSSKLVTIKWQINGGVALSSTSGSIVSLRDSAGYDDTPILHELSHYVMNNYSKSTNPGGSHFLSDCSEDLRLAFDEGRASSFGCGVRRYNSLPNANVYLKTDGGSGPGHVVNWYDLESEAQYPCDGDTSEVSISRSVWDVGDGATTTDTTPGVDEPHDLLSLPDAELWQVYTGPVKNATYVTDESLWDGWFDPSVTNGNYNEMKAIFSFFTIEFFHDAYETNNSTAAAVTVLPNDPQLHLTYFYDSNGDGKGEVDTDFFQ